MSTPLLCHIVIDSDNSCLRDAYQRRDPKCLTFDPTDSYVQDCDPDPSHIEEHELCKVCYSREISIVFMPCKPIGKRELYAYSPLSMHLQILNVRIELLATSIQVEQQI